MPLERMAMLTLGETAEAGILRRLDALIERQRQYFAEMGWPPEEERNEPDDFEMPEVYLHP